MNQPDPINHPLHYNQGKLEVIDVIEDWQLDYHLASALKYIARSRFKGDEITDLHKAIWFLKRKIGLLQCDIIKS